MDSKNKSIVKLVCLCLLTICFILVNIIGHFQSMTALYENRTIIYNDIHISYPFFTDEKNYYIHNYFNSLDNEEIDEIRYIVNFVDEYLNVVFKSFRENLIVDYHSMIFDSDNNLVPIEHIITNEEALIASIKEYINGSRIRITEGEIRRANKSFLFKDYYLEIFLTNYNEQGNISLVTIDYHQIKDYLNINVRLRNADGGVNIASTPEEPQLVVPIIPVPRKLIAFSFDDGPSRYTPPLLDILDEFDAKATFFMLGHNMLRRPEIVLDVVERGHEIANHTTDHTRLPTLRNANDIRSRIELTNDISRTITGEEMTLFRPPYGSLTERVRNLIEMPIILWSIDSRDWESRNAERIVAEVMRDIQEGDIVLFHDLYPTTNEAVRMLLQILYSNNFEVVTVSELFYRNNITPAPGNVYRHAR